jgi:hypothetical protein
MISPEDLVWIYLHAAADAISAFLKSGSHNLRYVGVGALAKVVRINPAAAQVIDWH